MIKHIWSVLCSKSTIDKDSNNISLFDVLEQLQVEIGLPSREKPSKENILPIECELVTLWIREDMDSPARGKVQPRFYLPSGREVKGGVIEIDLSKHQRSRSRIRIGALPLPESGYCWFTLNLQIDGESEWREVSRIPLQVEVRIQEATEGRI